MSTSKTALIIGASRGLGLGLAKQLLADGWEVTATVRDPQKADALKALGEWPCTAPGPSRREW